MLQFNKEAYLKDLEFLVNIDSGTRTVEGVKKVADVLSGKYRDMGFRVTQHVFDETLGPCVEAKNHPESEEIDLLIIGHMDTVFGPGTAAQRPFRIDEEGKAWGPGVADMKSGALLGAVLAENLLAADSKLRICFANNCDEEIGSPSSAVWICKLAEKSRYCLDFEPGRADGSFVKTRKGVLKVTVKIQGIASHAGVNPDAGANAVVEAANWITYFETYRQNVKCGARANFDVIHGGKAANVIADYAECEADIRFDTVKDLEQIMKEFRRLQKCPFDSRVTVELEESGYTPPMTVNENSVKLMKLMEEEGQKIGFDAKFIGTGGGSDASRVSSMGTATIDCCGPVGVNIHSDGEYIELNSIEERLKLLYNVCCRLE